MRSRLQLWHAFDDLLHALLPGIHRARLHSLALLTLGLLWAESVAIPRIAATLPLSVRRASMEKRLTRFLTNGKVEVGPVWRALLPVLLADRASSPLTLVFDPTPHNGRFAILCLGLLDRSRVLPLAWRVMPQQTTWSDAQITLLTDLCATVHRARPPRCQVTLLADRGITSPAVIALCRTLGWSFVLRVSVSAHQTNRVRVAGEPEQALWALVGGPGCRYAGPVQVYKEAGWVGVRLTIVWPARYPEPWVLLSDQPAGPAIARAYRRRFRVEATYQDCKRRGWNLEASKLTDPERFDRLLLALHLALWWALQLGHRVIRAGLRSRYDRADRRDLGVLRLGREHLRHELLHDRCPPLPIRCTRGHWAYTWCAS
jgi:hypothetical protein